ncbi:class I SAM-dependent rRNA methyltransferase [Kamptonema cortianum]|nr:class I SAM-dependent rRNA methyltransferase [Geitlerinema splendidum]MDK3157586.1 class I SAM-dependent rRNA methyltransferase [Kamptonema cortianum]
MDEAKVEGTVRLRPGREQRLRRGFPWAVKSEILDVIGNPRPGSVVLAEDSGGSFVGIGTYFAASFAPLRILSLNKEKIDQSFFAKKLEHAWKLRAPLLQKTNGVRACFSEADTLPGLVVDSFDGHAVVQVRTLGIENLKPLWLPEVQRICGPKSVFERSDYASRTAEGMDPWAGPLTDGCPDSVTINEGLIKMTVPIGGGLKTGHYLDQRASRLLLGELVLHGQKVLDLFCYSGGFALQAAKSGAAAVGIDSSAEAIALANENAAINSLSARFQVQNCFDFLQSDEDLYDWIVLDPPAIAKHRGQKNSLKHAIYKLMTLAAPRLTVGGTCIVCSCSHQLSLEEMIATCQDAASSANSSFSLDRVTLQDIDHPAPLSFPESLYLKCLWLRRVN